MYDFKGLCNYQNCSVHLILTLLQKINLKSMAKLMVMPSGLCRDAKPICLLRWLLIMFFYLFSMLTDTEQIHQLSGYSSNCSWARQDLGEGNRTLKITGKKTYWSLLLITYAFDWNYRARSELLRCAYYKKSLAPEMIIIIIWIIAWLRIIEQSINR